MAEIAGEASLGSRWRRTGRASLVPGR